MGERGIKRREIAPGGLDGWRAEAGAGGFVGAISAYGKTPEAPKQPKIIGVRGALVDFTNPTARGTQGRAQLHVFGGRTPQAFRRSDFRSLAPAV